MNDYDYDVTIEDFEGLLRENKQLIKILQDQQQRIDKAIEYIKWQYENPTYDNVWRKYEVEKLLSILGDKEK